jgi:hypothetical protein
VKWRNPVRCLLALILTSVAAIAAPVHDRLEIVWPTPNEAWEQGLPFSDFIQPTASGEPISGCYGCVRSHGMRFHEGIDIKALARDRRGEPTDQVFAAM